MLLQRELLVKVWRLGNPRSRQWQVWGRAGLLSAFGMVLFCCVCPTMWVLCSWGGWDRRRKGGKEWARLSWGLTANIYTFCINILLLSALYKVAGFSCLSQSTGAVMFGNIPCSTLNLLECLAQTFISSQPSKYAKSNCVALFAMWKILFLFHNLGIKWCMQKKLKP